MVTVELSDNDWARISELLSMAKVRCSGDVIVSCTEAARLLGRTTKTVSMMIRDGRLKKVTVDGSTGIRLSEIEQNRREAREPQ
jgi:excisionase family DNA binding protein